LAGDMESFCQPKEIKPRAGVEPSTSSSLRSARKSESIHHLKKKKKKKKKKEMENQKPLKKFNFATEERC